MNPDSSKKCLGFSIPNGCLPVNNAGYLATPLLAWQIPCGAAFAFLGMHPLRAEHHKEELIHRAAFHECADAIGGARLCSGGATGGSSFDWRSRKGGSLSRHAMRRTSASSAEAASPPARSSGAAAAKW
jgi:hypothetical protein